MKKKLPSKYKSYKYTDKLLKNTQWIIKKVSLENHKQLIKWGVQTHTLFEWITYITEEVGELAKAISEYEYREGTNKEIVREAIQVATLSLKVAEMLEDSE